MEIDVSASVHQNLSHVCVSLVSSPVQSSHTGLGNTGTEDVDLGYRAHSPVIARNQQFVAVTPKVVHVCVRVCVCVCVCVCVSKKDER